MAIPRLELVFSVVFSVGTLSISSVAVTKGASDLKSLYESHRWFELRDVAAKTSVPLFYQGAVACAFNDLPRCQQLLDSLLKGSPDSEDAVEAHRTLASAYLRVGKYSQALLHVDALLSIRPDDSDALSAHPLLKLLGEYPEQQATQRGRTRLRLTESGVPVSIHGIKGSYWFDTGASYSVLSERDAQHFGLKVLEVSAQVGVSTGEHVKTKVAIADEMRIGSMTLRNVAFLVFPDGQPPFNQEPEGSRGLIGIPVLMAFQTFSWANRRFEINGSAIKEVQSYAELCFDGSMPVVRVEFDNRRLSFALDTGATNTDLFPPFAQEFPAIVSAHSKAESYKSEGVSSIKYLDAANLGSIEMHIGGFPVKLNPARVLLKPTGESSKFFEGNLGIDLLQQAHQVVFDFREMKLLMQ
jgi:predicted aspartyl protease